MPDAIISKMFGMKVEGIEDKPVVEKKDRDSVSGKDAIVSKIFDGLYDNKIVDDKHSTESFGHDLTAIYWDSELAGFIYMGGKPWIDVNKFPELVDYYKRQDIRYTAGGEEIFDPMKSKPMQIYLKKKGNMDEGEKEMIKGKKIKDDFWRNYARWEEEAIDEFLDRHRSSKFEREDIEVTEDGGVNVKGTNLLFPAGTVIPWEESEYYIDSKKQGDEVKDALEGSDYKDMFSPSLYNEVEEFYMLKTQMREFEDKIKELKKLSDKFSDPVKAYMDKNEEVTFRIENAFITLQKKKSIGSGKVLADLLKKLSAKQKDLLTALKARYTSMSTSLRVTYRDAKIKDGLIESFIVFLKNTIKKFFAPVEEALVKFEKAVEVEMSVKEKKERKGEKIKDAWRPEAGDSVSQGTLRPQDLIMAFALALHEIDRGAFRLALKDWKDAPYMGSESEIEDWVERNRDDADYLIADLMDALSDVAPSGTYFGAHPGDGSDFGFWEYDEDVVGELEKDEDKRIDDAFKIKNKNVRDQVYEILAEDEYSEAYKMISKVSTALEYDIFGVYSFCLHLLEDVNAHTEMKEVEALFEKNYRKFSASLEEGDKVQDAEVAAGGFAKINTRDIEGLPPYKKLVNKIARANKGIVYVASVDERLGTANIAESPAAIMIGIVRVPLESLTWVETKDVDKEEALKFKELDSKKINDDSSMVNGKYIYPIISIYSEEEHGEEDMLDFLKKEYGLTTRHYNVAQHGSDNVLTIECDRPLDDKYVVKIMAEGEWIDAYTLRLPDSDINVAFVNDISRYVEIDDIEIALEMTYLGDKLKDQEGIGKNQGDKPGSGTGGSCVCPSCGHTVPHETDQPCNKVKCPECGAIMTRDSLGDKMASHKTAKCPTCGGKYLVATGYCPKCKKKVAKANPGGKEKKSKDSKTSGRRSMEDLMEYFKKLKVDVVGSYETKVQDEEDPEDSIDVLIYHKTSEIYNDTKDFNEFFEQAKKAFPEITDDQVNKLFDDFEGLVKAYETKIGE